MNREGWKYCKLGDLCAVIAGQSPEGKFYNTQAEGIEFHQGKKAFGKIYLEQSNVWTTKITKIAEPGDIVMSVRAPVGPTNLVDRHICIGRGLAAIRCKKSVNKDFILYALKKIELSIDCNAGAVFESINKGDIEKINIPYTSEEEQQRIVQYLDNAFSNIDKIKERAERQIEDAKGLFQAQLLKAINQQNPSKVKLLEECCEFKSGFAFKSNLFTTTGYPIIRISDIQDGKIDDSSVVYFNPASYNVDLTKYKVFPDDILIAMSGGTTGKIGINQTNNIYYLNQRVGVFRENKNVLSHKYLFYYLLTKSEESLKIAAGAAQPNLSTAQIKSFAIPVPSLQEQQQIVEELDALSEKTKTIEEDCKKIIMDCEAMKGALLREVFG